MLTKTQVQNGLIASTSFTYSFCGCCGATGFPQVEPMGMVGWFSKTPVVEGVWKHSNPIYYLDSDSVEVEPGVYWNMWFTHKGQPPENALPNPTTVPGVEYTTDGYGDNHLKETVFPKNTYHCSVSQVEHSLLEGIPLEPRWPPKMDTTSDFCAAIKEHYAGSKFIFIAREPETSTPECPDQRQNFNNFLELSEFEVVYESPLFYNRTHPGRPSDCLRLIIISI